MNRPLIALFAVILTALVSSRVAAQPAAPDLVVYDEAVQSPWINASWDATVRFQNTNQVYSGTYSVKVNTTSGSGALSLRHGSAGSPGIGTNSFETFVFVLYSQGSTTSFSIFFENDQGQAFPQVNRAVTENAWVIVSIPISELNPNNLTIHRFAIQPASGKKRTFYVDDLQFKGKLLPPPPVLVYPSNGATDISTSPVLVWNESAGADSYHLQVAEAPDFASTIVDQSNVSDTSYSLSGLLEGSSYFWRVNASNGGGTSAWSDVWSFTTVPPPPLPGEPGWVRQTSGTTAHLGGVSFVDANVGTVVGQDGTILRTDDGGGVWTSQSSGTLLTLNGVSMIDASMGFAVGYGGVLLRTGDGGQTWSPQSSGTTLPLWDVEFPDPLHGYIVGGLSMGTSSVILRTSDGGNTWIQVPISSPPLFAVDFISADVGWAVGRFGTILKTTDGGVSWISQGTTQYYLVSVSFVTATDGWVMHSEGIYHTTDGGTTWTSQSPATTRVLSRIWFTDTDTGTVVGTQGMIFRTTDAGVTWQDQSLGIANDLGFVMFTNANTGTATGTNGIILHTTTGGYPLPQQSSESVSGPIDSQGSNQTPVQFGLNQNYPNPFNPATVIRYEVPEPMTVKLQVFNILGQLVSTLIDQSQPAGYHEVTFNASSLPSGVYVYRLTGQPLSENRQPLLVVRKMILAR